MLKVRLMGTKNDIAWFQKILQRHPKIEVMELSELYSNKGTSKYYICAVQHNLFIEADSEKLKPMTSRQFVGKWKGAKFR